MLCFHGRKWFPEGVMLPETETRNVTRRRAILTDRERELLRDEDAGNQRYVAVSRVRTKIQEELADDAKILQHHHPDLYEELREVVCEDSQEAAVEGEEPPREESDPSPPPEPRRDEGGAQQGESGFEIPDTAGVDLPDEISDEVWRVVDEVSASWDDDARLENRRKAAAAALQYALDHDVYLGKSSDAVEAIRERYPVEGQSEETWWRQNVRDVLKEVGDYSRGQHGYAVEDLDDV